MNYSRKVGLVWVLLVAVPMAGLGTSLAGRPAGAAIVQRQDDNTNDVIVRLRDGEDSGDFDDDYDDCDIEDDLAGLPIYRVQVRDGVSADAVMTQMSVDPRVQYTSRVIPVRPPMTARQYTSVFDGGKDPRKYVNQNALRQIGRSAAAGTDGQGVTVAVLDTGISTRATALAGKLVPGRNVFEGNANTDDAPNNIDDNGNGLKDEATGHGTMVAGIIALVAPQAKLMPVKVLNSDGVGDLWTISEGLRWAALNGADVVNLSLGMQENSNLLRELLDVLEDLEVVVVTSAGNNNTTRAQFPAGISRCIAVAAVTGKNKKAGFSNYGSVVDVSAPGVGIRSTFWNGRFAVWSGTSFAAPFVAGQAALMRAVAPDVKADDIGKLIEDTAKSIDRQNRRYRGKLGEGLIAVDRAVQAAREEQEDQGD